MKIRAQVMLDNDLFTLLVGLQQQHRVKSLSVIVNKIIREAFTYQKQLENKDKVIDNLQKTITEIGTRAESYRLKLHEEARHEIETNAGEKK